MRQAGTRTSAPQPRAPTLEELALQLLYLKKSEIEPGLVAGIKRELSAPEVLEKLQRRVRQRLRKGATAPDNRHQIAKLEREVAALVEAIASGALRTSPALAERLQHTEAALARLKAQPTGVTRRNCCLI